LAQTSEDGLELSKQQLAALGHLSKSAPKQKTTKPLYVSLKEDDPHDITLEHVPASSMPPSYKLKPRKTSLILAPSKCSTVVLAPILPMARKMPRFQKTPIQRTITEAVIAKKLLADAPAKGKGRRTTRGKARNK
jgi:hypothetical protein